MGNRSRVLLLMAVAAPAWGAQEAYRSLRHAAVDMPLRATLESQSEASGAVFTGGPAEVQAGSLVPAEGPRFSPAPLEPTASPRRYEGDAVPAPGEGEKNSVVLKTARIGGSAAFLAGLGLLGYAVAIQSAGPVGWAAALIFFGGMAAYLSHRALKGKPLLG